MTAKQKIEELTNGWYGFAVFAGMISLLQSGFGLFSLFAVAGSTLFSIFVAWFLGRRLLARSSITRLVLIVLSGFSSVFGTLAVLKLGWAFLGDWSFSLLLTIVLSAGSVFMNVRSFRTLMDSTVKAHFS